MSKPNPNYLTAIKNVLQTEISLVNLGRILLAAIFLYFVGYKYFYEKKLLGFGEDTNKSLTIEEVINPKDGKIIKLKKETEQFQSAKTLWDWLGLSATFAIPIVLYFFQTSEQRRSEKRAEIESKQAEERAEVEKDIAEDNLREQALEAYIDRMSAILINQQTRSELIGNRNNAHKDNPVCDVARIRTATILRRLEDDIKRQNRVLHFLQDSEILGFLLESANFANANLKGANFCNINLNHAIFDGANLSGANFNSTKLFRANFSNANLSGANFTNARLIEAIFDGANLNGANLQNASIQGATFINTDLTNAILIDTKTWDEENRDDNFYVIYHEEESYEMEDTGKYGYSPAYTEDEPYLTDFSEAKLINTNLLLTNFSGAINLTVEQLKKAKKWDDAIYGDELSKKLGLPQKLTSIMSTIFKNRDFKPYKDIDLTILELVKFKILVSRSFLGEILPPIKGEMTGFTILKEGYPLINIKTSHGTLLKKIDPEYVYIYTN